MNGSLPDWSQIQVTWFELFLIERTLLRKLHQLRRILKPIKVRDMKNTKVPQRRAHHHETSIFHVGPAVCLGYL